MKHFILTLVCFALGACSSKSTTFNESEEQSKTAISSEAPASGDNEPEISEQVLPEQIEDVDKAIDMKGLPVVVEGTQRSETVCRNGGDERIVSVIDTKEGHCGVVYTKFGKKTTQGFARHEMDFCDDLYKSIINNLCGPFDCGDACPETESPGEMEVSVKGEGSGSSGEENPVVEKDTNPPPEESETAPATEGVETEEDKSDDENEDQSSTEVNGTPSHFVEDDEGGGQMISRRDSAKLEGNERSGAVCKKDDNKITVSVIDTREGPCVVVYTKSGNTVTEAVSPHDMSLCDKIFNRLVNEDLIAKGYNCKVAGYSAE